MDPLANYVIFADYRNTKNKNTKCLKFVKHLPQIVILGLASRELNLERFKQLHPIKFNTFDSYD